MKGSACDNRSDTETGQSGHPANDNPTTAGPSPAGDGVRRRQRKRGHASVSIILFICSYRNSTNLTERINVPILTGNPGFCDRDPFIPVHLEAAASSTMPSHRPAAPRGLPPRGRQGEHENPPDQLGRRKSTLPGEREHRDPPHGREPTPPGEDIATIITIAAHLHLRWDTAPPLHDLLPETGGETTDDSRKDEGQPQGPPSRGHTTTLARRRARDIDTTRALARNTGQFARSFRAALVLSHVRHPRMSKGLQGFRVDLIFLNNRYALARLPADGAPEGVWLRFRPPNLAGNTAALKQELRGSLWSLATQTGVRWDKTHPPLAIATLVTSEYVASGPAQRPTVESWKQDARRIRVATERIAHEWGSVTEEITDVSRTRLFYHFHFVVTSVREAIQCSLDDALELLLPALNGIPHSIAFARAVDRLRRLHPLRPREIAEATIWLASVCAAFAPTARPIVMVREIMCHVHFPFPPPYPHAQGAATPRPSRPQDEDKEAWITCATARATIMRGGERCSGELAPERLCTPCCDATNAPGSGIPTTRAYLRVLAVPCDLATQYARNCASESTRETMKHQDTPVRCHRYVSCRFSGAQCYPPMPTDGALAVLPRSSTDPVLPIILPEFGEGRPAESDQSETDSSEELSLDIQVVDPNGDGERSRGRTRRSPQRKQPSSPTRRDCARVTAHSCGRTGGARSRPGARLRRRKRNGVTRSQDDLHPSPRRRANGEIFTLADGLRRTQGATCDYCGHTNHTALDCHSRRRALRAGPPDRRATQDSPNRGNTEHKTPGRRTAPLRRSSSPPAPRVAHSNTAGYHPSDSDSPPGHCAPPRRLSVHARLGRVDGRRRGIPQIDGAEEIVRSRSPSFHPPETEGEEGDEVLARARVPREEEVPDLTSSSEGEGEDDADTDRTSDGDEFPAWDPSEPGATTAPLTHPGYRIKAFAAGHTQQFLVDSGLDFSCIRQEDLLRIRRAAGTGTVRHAWGGGVVLRLQFLHLGVKEVTAHVLPRGSALESSLGWDTLADWNARMEFAHDFCACPADQPHLTVPGACSPLTPEPELREGSPFH